MKSKQAPKIIIDQDPIHVEMYYLYLLKRIKEGFYQKRGFIINPKAKIKTSVEVVFPKLPNVLDNPIIKKSIEYYFEKKNFPFVFNEKEYETLSQWQSFAEKLKVKPDAVQIKVLEKSLLTHQQEIYDFLVKIHPEVKNYTFRIIPVNFGTRVSFFNRPFNKEIIVTWRYDLQDSLSHIFEGIVSETVIMEGNTGDKNLFEDIMGWYEREAICDFLTLRLLKELKLFHLVETFNGTVKALKHRKYHSNASEKYLLDLGFAGIKGSPERNIKIQERLLHIDDKKVYLTEMETKFMDTVLKNAPYAATFDEIAESMWGEDSERFSLYALSRTQANIRLKLRALGHEDLLQTIRGKGVAINS